MLAVDGFMAKKKCSLQGESIVIGADVHPITSVKKYDNFKVGIIAIIVTLIVFCIGLGVMLYVEVENSDSINPDIDIIVALVFLVMLTSYFMNFMRFRSWWLINGGKWLLVESGDDLCIDQRLTDISALKPHIDKDHASARRRMRSKKSKFVWILAVSALVGAFNWVMKALNDPLGDRMFESWYLVAFCAVITSLFVQYDNIKWKN